MCEWLLNGRVYECKRERECVKVFFFFLSFVLSGALECFLMICFYCVGLFSYFVFGAQRNYECKK